MEHFSGRLSARFILSSICIDPHTEMLSSRLPAGLMSGSTMIVAVKRFGFVRVLQVKRSVPGLGFSLTSGVLSQTRPAEFWSHVSTVSCYWGLSQGLSHWPSSSSH